MIAPSHLEAFRQILGPHGLLAEPTDLAAYETPARYASGRAACVLRPASTAEVSACVGHCVRHEISFVPQSGNTGLTNGSTPDGSGRQIVLSLDRLTEPLEVRPEDRIAVVGAGVRLSTLNARLEPHGCWLPIDLGADPMVGGMVATNTGGARFLRYGDMRRHVVGLEVVLTDRGGTVFDLTTDLRKNNARLDLKHLFIGSSGAFGVITKAVIEVHPRPAFTSAALLIPRDEDAIMGILAALERELGDELSAFEGMSGAALARAFAHVPSLRNPFAGGCIPAYALLVEVSSFDGRGDGSALEQRLVDVISTRAEAMGLSDALFGRAASFWAIRHAIPEALRASGPVIGFDLTFARSRVFPFRRALRQELAERFSEFEVCDFGHVADGGVHFNVLARQSRIAPERIDALRRHVVGRAVADFGGGFSGEHGLGPNVQPAYDAFEPALIRTYADRLQTALKIRASDVVKFGHATSGSA